MKYGNIILNRRGRVTVGDDIQLIAIEHLYEKMGIDYSDVVRIPLSELATYEGEYVIMPISFPLYSYYSGSNITCFSDRIIPVFLGVSIMDSEYSDADVAYLKRFEPIGCRDEYTLGNMRRHGIEAYLNGCTTLTFDRRRNGADGRTKVFCVDIEEELRPFIPQDILPHCEFVEHVVLTDNEDGASERMAKAVFQRYIDEAAMIITSRLHAALPCTAFGIPVVLAKTVYSFRFPMVESYIPVYTGDEFGRIDWNPTPPDYEELKERIIANDIRRLRGAYEHHEAMLGISAFHEHPGNKRELYLDGASAGFEYIDSTFKPDEAFDYVLWGVVQTANMVHDYIKRHYPHGRLVAVIDRAKRAEFCGRIPTTREYMEDNKDTHCFVCAPAILPEAREFFAEIGHDRVCYCWADGLAR